MLGTHEKAKVCERDSASNQ